MNRSYKYILPATLFLGLGISSSVFATNPDNVDFSVTVNPSLTLSVSSNNVNLNILPSSTGTFGKTNFTVTSSTNNIAGYTLTMANGTTYLESSTLDPNTGAKPHIETLANGNITESTFTNATTSADGLNKWGIAINTGNYNPASTTASTIKETDTYNQVADTTTINIASKLDLNIPAGTYADTFNLQLVANTVDPPQPYPDDPCDSNPDCDSTSGVTLQRAYELAYTAAHKGMYEEITPGSNTYQYIDSWNGVNYQGNGRDVRFLIQDMTPSICNTATVIGSTALVLDVRDQTSYRIVKAADGRCWMQDNLALDAVATKNILSSANTNATQAAINNFITSSGTAPQAGWATTAVSYETDSIINQPRISISSKDVIPLDDYFEDPLASIVASDGWKVGVYYNYCAASVGTHCYGWGDSSSADPDPTSAIDVKNDICPANWRMPTFDSYDANTRPDGGEYGTLIDAYPAISGGDSGYIRFRKAFRLPLSGEFTTDYGEPWEHNQGFYAKVWSSTFCDIEGGEYGDGSSMLALIALVSPSQSVGQEFEHRDFGFSVRCIAKTGTEPAPSGN